jgi:hypothetical protein
MFTSIERGAQCIYNNLTTPLIMISLALKEGVVMESKE